MVSWLHFLVIAAALFMVAKSLPTPEVPLSQQQITNGACGLDIEQQKYSCQIDKNETLKEEFEYSIREKHGITDPTYDGVFIVITATSLDQSIRCRSLSACHNGNVTWCINVYHPEENIEACLDERGLINATSLAQNLDLPSHYEIDSRGRLQAKKLPLYFSHSYLTCTAHYESQDCTRKTFTSLSVSLVQDINDEPPTVSISPGSETNTTKLIIGETNIFYCAGQYNRSTFLPVHYGGSWQINGVDQTDVILEDPYCDPTNNSDCPKDLQNIHLKENRVRVYQLLQVISNCPVPTYVISNWMVIDDATEEDAKLSYVCSAGYVSFPSSMTIEASADLRLEAVYPQDSA